jgi:transcriptional regulator with XRE-family HTH domain
VLEKKADRIRFIGMSKNELGPTPQDRGTLGTCLWTARKSQGWSLREAEEQSAVSNAYISQIESGTMPKPSPGILLKLSNTYKIPYQQLMEMAGHLAPAGTATKRRGALPTSTLADIDLTADEEKEVRQYIAFIKMRRRQSS